MCWITKARYILAVFTPRPMNTPVNTASVYRALMSKTTPVFTGREHGSRAVNTGVNKKASIPWQDSAPPISGYWPTSERMEASDAMTSRLLRYEAKCVQRRCFQCGSVPLRSDIKGTELPPANPNILIPLERQLIALQPCRWQFLYSETLQQTSRPLLSKFVWKTTNLGIWSPFWGS